MIDSHTIETGKSTMDATGIRGSSGQFTRGEEEGKDDTDPGVPAQEQSRAPHFRQPASKRNYRFRIRQPVRSDQVPVHREASGRTSQKRLLSHSPGDGPSSDYLWTRERLPSF